MGGLQWKRRVRGMLTLLFVSVCLTMLISHLLWPSITDLTEVEKCPACYGTSFCPAITGGFLTLHSFGAFAGFVNILGSKNVLFGMLGNQKVVLKKLGHTVELEQLDKMICKGAGLSSSCHVHEAIWQQGDLLHSMRQHVASQDSSLLLCPSVANLECLLSSVLYKTKGTSTEASLANIWTTLMINPEPLLLQVLQEQDGWPVTKYMGACGRVVVEEYAGEILTSYHNAPWLQRVHLAHQLLIAAHNFTDSHPLFGFYLTDISADNIAVDAQGKLRFVDLENVIVVDKNVPNEDRPQSWTIPHVSETFDCEGCFAFSSEDICSHRMSDHNFYAVCQHLLSPLAALDMIPGGLLHDMPPAHARVSELVQKCSESTEPSGRLRAAQDLTELLAEVLQQHGYSSMPKSPSCSLWDGCLEA
ncbi:deleted in autism protein 1 homolog isoform X2 [Zootermopsis nevadensis]|uniref:deleted in autism protein 1 homolog isoform X2 n=1 Tax=Zootermopsis nevadensis TaxID=136037 RepID=UPI000B8E34B2|nr:deleted in autism protein 1 homolog isoform X2 [Zootermopsis nevadensis]